jgi:FKBP-type peptidyl-prolyl cis-trans isomerase (trigger factor)
MADLYSNAKVSKKKGQAEISAEVPWEILSEYYETRLAELRDNFEAPGFRKGKVPPEVFKAHVHEHRVLEDALEDALGDIYPKLIDAEKLDVVGRPQLSITKLALGNPAEFKAIVGLAPEVKLPDYKKIAKEVSAELKTPEVTDAALEEVVNTLLKMRSPAQKEGETPEVLALTDEFVKTLGAFENVADFRAKLRKNMEDEKAMDARRAARETLAEKLITAAKMELPEILIEDELSTMETQLLADLAGANTTLEDYLKRSGKTREELLKDHRAYVERQLKMRFILEDIAKAENIKPAAEEVAVESKIMAERYPDLEPERIRIYIERLLTNEKVLQFLEGREAGTS